MMNKLVGVWLMAACCAAPAWAGSATGIVKKVLVGRSGHEVFFQVAGQISDYPCGAHPQAYNYTFSISGHAAGQEMLSALLTAYASGGNLTVQGSGTCNTHSTLEDVEYLVLGN